MNRPARRSLSATIAAPMPRPWWGRPTNPIANTLTKAARRSRTGIRQRGRPAPRRRRRHVPCRRTAPPKKDERSSTSSRTRAGCATPRSPARKPVPHPGRALERKPGGRLMVTVFVDSPAVTARPGSWRRRPHRSGRTRARSSARLRGILGVHREDALVAGVLPGEQVARQVEKGQSLGSGVARRGTFEVGPDLVRTASPGPPGRRPAAHRRCPRGAPQPCGSHGRTSTWRCSWSSIRERDACRRIDAAAIGGEMRHSAHGLRVPDESNQLVADVRCARSHSPPPERCRAPRTHRRGGACTRRRKRWYSTNVSASRPALAVSPLRNTRSHGTNTSSNTVSVSIILCCDETGRVHGSASEWRKSEQKSLTPGVATGLRTRPPSPPRLCERASRDHDHLVDVWVQEEVYLGAADDDAVGRSTIRTYRSGSAWPDGPFERSPLTSVRAVASARSCSRQ